MHDFSLLISVAVSSISRISSVGGSRVRNCGLNSRNCFGRSILTKVGEEVLAFVLLQIYCYTGSFTDIMFRYDNLMRNFTLMQIFNYSTIYFYLLFIQK